MNRIKELRDVLGFNQAELAEKLGIQKSLISEYESDKKEPSKAVLIAMIEKLKVSANWLLTGEGTMFLDASPKELVSTSQKIPLLRQTVSCGPGCNWEDNDIVEEFLEPLSLLPSLRGKDIYAFKVRGTSMVGAGIQDGDIVLFDASFNSLYCTDDVYVFALDGGVFCKLLKFDPIKKTIKIYSVHSIKLEEAEELRTLDCTNPDDIEVIHIFGRVVALLRENRLVKLEN